MKKHVPFDEKRIFVNQTFFVTKVLRCGKFKLYFCGMKGMRWFAEINFHTTLKFHYVDLQQKTSFFEKFTHVTLFILP